MTISESIDPNLILVLPDTDEVDPEISIVVPALNESFTIGEFVAWCHEGLRKADIKGEILIVDSSTDNTGAIALAAGARVLKVPKRGLGRAYIDALPFIRGKYALLGDCDLTYDFRELEPFVKELRNGADFVMGSRFRGYIEPGAMPALHRYFGTPLTTFLLNLIYKSSYSDIHCGMRALTTDAFRRLNIQSQSWEYASEMVLKAARMKMKIAEAPIRFYKDREGRLSHHKRSGWFSPWHAGWINLKAMFLNAPEFFLFRPGGILFCLGFLLTLITAFGPRTIGPVTLSLHWMLLGLTLATVGSGALQLGILARVRHNFDPRFTSHARRVLTYDRGTLGGLAMFLVGTGFAAIALIAYLRGGLALRDVHYTSVFGLLLIILGFQLFTFTLVFELMLYDRNRQ
ncbi:glycosyltransferase family 2 protein [Syntrophorhabdus aromaticivorans]|uniref:Glycosyltransferase family 2 protein n=1 Tax=Syntrophorhabdus aromaticivorans TaxID=328301 RepID=A0A971M1N8_9BACT|nr:glycosyltransferase family 2 protein [Syntrophorhabdus aromaticivorans]NLW34467.1 glycosyltransferase family 2 protein [Syntrophorhabdus aromaticivorans]